MRKAEALALLLHPRYQVLVNWWETSFSGAERSSLQRVLAQIGNQTPAENPFARAGQVYENERVVALLNAFLGWLRNEEERKIAFKIIEKLEELLDDTVQPVTRHFIYQQKIETFYRWRDVDDFALGKAIEGCNQQIDFAPTAAVPLLLQFPEMGLPRHHGYTQLAIIEEKRGNFQEAIRLCAQAEVRGWAGDWQKRLARLRKRADA